MYVLTLMAFTIYSLLVYVFSVINLGIDFSISETRKVLVNSIFIVALFSINFEQRKMIIKGLFVFSVFASIASFLGFIFGDGRSQLLGGPNFVGINLAIGIFWGLYIYLSEEFEISNSAFIVMVVCQFLGLASTVSGRSFLFVFIFILFLICCLFFQEIFKIAIKLKVNLKALLGCFCSVFFVGVAGWVVFKLVCRFQDNYWISYLLSKVFDPSNSSNSMRVILYEKGISYISQVPFYGGGLDSSRYFFLKDIGFPTYSHNNFIEILIGLGWIGLTLYVICLLNLLYKALTNISLLSSYFLISFVVNVVVMSFFMSLYSNLLISVSFVLLYKCLDDEKNRVDIFS